MDIGRCQSYGAILGARRLARLAVRDSKRVEDDRTPTRCAAFGPVVGVVDSIKINVRTRAWPPSLREVILDVVLSLQRRHKPPRTGREKD